MASHEGSRKRLKISRTESKPTPSSSSKAQHITMPSVATGNETIDPASNKATCQHEQTLKTLHTDLDAMRGLVTCKICVRLLYEPYALSCGHTYCYSCLRDWLVQGHKKTCPDCRAAVTQQPTPNYIIRELVLVFVSRNELLPDGETSEEHHKFAKEEGEIVAVDRANTDPREGGLFKGRFNRKSRPLMLPIRDPGDGVDRCPQCHWELEDDYCNHCGISMGGENSDSSDYDEASDFTDDELDHELDTEDAEAVWGADGPNFDEATWGADGQDEWLGNHAPEDWANPNVPDFYRRHGLLRDHHGGGRSNSIDIRSTADTESDDDDYDPEMHDFIVNDQNIQEASSDEEQSDATETVRAPPSGRRRGVVVISDDENDTAASTAGGAQDGSDEDSEDEGPVARASGRRKRRGRVLGRRPQARAQTISSDEESSEGSNSDNENDDDNDDVNDVHQIGGFSPLDHRSESEDENSVNNTYDYESDAPSSVQPTFDDDDEHEESDGSEDDDRWGPRDGSMFSNGPHLHPAASHRLHTLGHHSNRFTNPDRRYPAARISPIRSRPSPNATLPQGYSNGRTGQHDRQSTHGRGLFQAYPSATYSAPHRYGAAQQQPNRALSAPNPFQLGNTLANVNYNHRQQQNNPFTSNSYNQRHQQMRANPNHRTVSGGSSQSSMGGGVDVRSSGSSGSSTTIGPASAARRKRALSIASDQSY